jgi:hypothetical protein
VLSKRKAAAELGFYSYPSTSAVHKVVNEILQNILTMMQILPDLNLDIIM